ncbi:MAG: hypothetical protein ACYC35_20730 [Pirellulales bacterium]
MIAIAKSVGHSAPAWHAGFLSLWPAIRRQAELSFRSFPPCHREEAVAATVALALASYLRLVEQGRQDVIFPSALARYAAAQVRAGRNLGGKLNCHEVLSHYAQRKKDFAVERLDRRDRHTGKWIAVAVEGHRMPVPDQAAFRIDYPRWLGSLSRRDRQVAKALSLGYSTQEVAGRFRISPARISQLRHELHGSWERFHAGRRPAEHAAPA